MSAADFEATRRRLLALVDAVAASDKSLRARADYLRVRLLALGPGEPGLDGLKRARLQRARELGRIRDEIALRDSGVPPTALPDLERRVLERALSEAEAKLRDFPEPAATVLPAARAAKEQSLLHANLIVRSWQILACCLSTKKSPKKQALPVRSGIDDYS